MCNSQASMLFQSIIYGKAKHQLIIVLCSPELVTEEFKDMAGITKSQLLFYCNSTSKER